MSDRERERMQHYLDVVALGYKERSLMMEPIISLTDTEPAEDGRPKALGLALHQHSQVPIINEEGVSSELVCDIIVLDPLQILQLKKMLGSTTVYDKEGNSLDDQ